jgi:hypothetical protein
MLAMGCFINFYKPGPVILKDHPGKFPLELEGWKGRVIDSKDEGIVMLPGPDIEIRGSYSGPTGETLYLIVGYYEYKKQEKEFVHYTLQKLYDKRRGLPDAGCSKSIYYCQEGID